MVSKCRCCTPRRCAPNFGHKSIYTPTFLLSVLEIAQPAQPTCGRVRSEQRRGAQLAAAPHSIAFSPLFTPCRWAVGAYVLNNDVALNWGGIEGFRIAGKQGIVVIAACQLVLMGGPEYAR